MFKKLIILFLVGGVLYSQDLKRNPMNTGQFSELSNTEKIEHVKKWFRDGINVPYLFAQEFAEAGGIEIIPWLFEELPKHEYYDIYGKIYNVQLDFITDVLIYFREKDLLTMYERYYIAGILEAKIMNYVKKYKKFDLSVLGTNANIWMFLNIGNTNQLTSVEKERIVRAKYKVMGLLD